MDIYYKFLDSNEMYGYILLCPKEDFDKTSRIEETDNYKEMRDILKKNGILNEDNFLGQFYAKNILKQYKYQYDFYDKEDIIIKDEKEFLDADDELFKSSVIDTIKNLELDLNLIRNNDLTWTGTDDEKEKIYYYISKIEDSCPILKVGTHLKDSEYDFEIGYYRADIGRIIKRNTCNELSDGFYITDECDTDSIQFYLDEIKSTLWNKMGKIKFKQIKEKDIPFHPSRKFSKDEIDTIIKIFS